MNKIPYTKPSITEREIAYVTDAISTGWGDRCYEYITRFERLLAQSFQVEYAIATSSCTGALHMGLAALGIGPGDEVILADTNWIASVSPVLYLGATPVFVDIDPINWCISPEKIEEKITAKTKAIIAVHLYGNLADMDSLLKIGEVYGIPVIEDAAEAIGALYKGKSAGSIGRFGVFSFHGTKTMTTGEGGAFITNDRDLFEAVKTLSNHGRSQYEARQFWPERIGFKYKISNVQAAIGVAQLERLNELVFRKIDIFLKYAKLLKDVDDITLNFQRKDDRNAYWMPTAVFSRECGVSTSLLLSIFQRQNIDARVFFSPLSSLPMFKPMMNPAAYDLPGRSINLPSFHDITDTEITRVVDCLLEALSRVR